MSDTLSAARVEPTVTPVPAQSSVVPVASAAALPTGQPGADASKPVPPSFEQLSRIEDKAARIEEKYARSEARMERVTDKVDAAMERMSGVALQSDLAAVRGEVAAIARRVRSLPGLGGLLLTSLLTAVITAAAVVALFKYGGPALLPVR